MYEIEIQSSSSSLRVLCTDEGRSDRCVDYRTNQTIIMDPGIAIKLKRPFALQQ